MSKGSKTNKYDRQAQVIEVSETLGITHQLAKELLILAGGDVELVCECSAKSNGLDHCKANIINQRLEKSER